MVIKCANTQHHDLFPDGYYRKNNAAQAYGLSPNTFTATLQPDPPTAGDCAITATGTFVIPEGSKLLVQVFDSTANAVGEPLTADICTNVTIPADVPQPPFALAISIVDTTGNILGCTF
ncbi:23239_t:CDS:2, partial [Rhizophagus irregularis]